MRPESAKFKIAKFKIAKFKIIEFKIAKFKIAKYYSSINLLLNEFLTFLTFC